MVEGASDEVCPRCGSDLRFGGFLLSTREDDGARVCQVPWLCGTCETAWMAWADRPEDDFREDSDAYRFLARRE